MWCVVRIQPELPPDRFVCTCMWRAIKTTTRGRKPYLDHPIILREKKQKCWVKSVSYIMPSVLTGCLQGWQGSLPPWDCSHSGMASLCSTTSHPLPSWLPDLSKQTPLPNIVFTMGLLPLPSPCLSNGSLCSCPLQPSCLPNGSPCWHPLPPPCLSNGCPRLGPLSFHFSYQWFSLSIVMQGQHTDRAQRPSSSHKAKVAILHICVCRDNIGF